MKPTKAVVEALAKMTAEGRVTGVAVNAAALGTPGPFPDLKGESEAEFQKRFVAFARSLGWARIAHFRKVRVQRKGGGTYWETPVAEDGKGFLDLELVRDRLVKVELKVGRNKPTPEQEEWLAAYRAAGVECHVFYPKDWELITEVLT